MQKHYTVLKYFGSSIGPRVEQDASQGWW